MSPARSIAPSVAAHLEALYQRSEPAAAIARDPIQFPRRYTTLADREIAAVFASGLAYGRVSSFQPQLERVFQVFDARGGPAAFVDGLDPSRDLEPLAPIVYRWNRGPDLYLLAGAIADLRRRDGGLRPVLGDVTTSIAPGLARLIDALRAGMVRHARTLGVQASNIGDLSRGARYLVPSPADGSACKRWNLALRWLVRPTTEGVDLGCWDLPTRALVMPLDTHVLRISQLLGITERKDASWRTAVEVTEALRTLDPDDPVRFDFALAHVGISGGCLGRREATICPHCPLTSVCQAPEPAR